MKSNLFVISGPSGVGKDSLVALIFKNIKNIHKWITCTTRKPRSNEIDGVQYFFKSKEEFLNMIKTDKFVEYNEFAGNYYGTPKEYALNMLNNDKSLLANIDVNGAMNVKKIFPKSKLIFIEPPSIEELKNRLVNRGTETFEEIEKRLMIVSSEMKKKDLFDISFINDDLEYTADQISSYISKSLSK